MKRIVLSMLAGLVVAPSAFAVPSLGDRRVLCEKYSDKYVWVEKAEACVPLNPCLSDAPSIRNAYCDGRFSDVSVKNYGAAEQLVQQYVGGNFTVRKQPGEKNFIVATQAGTDVLATYDYLVFEFQEIGLKDLDIDEDAFRGACLAYDGLYNNDTAECLAPNTTCNNVAALASFVYDGDVKVKAQYWDEETEESKEIRCFLYK